jgi:NAD(P)-dependent dehydrogenase (short-subunit alcohol dehydrogenase family)
MSTAMIWGANGSMGRALVERLTQPDGAAGTQWQVWAIARDPQGLETLTPNVLQADFGNTRSVQQAVLAVGEAGAEIDLWVYAAGDIVATPAAEMLPETWRRILDANLNGAYLTTHYSLPLLTETAHIFYLGAVSERMRLPGLSAYAAAKAGLEGFAEALRKEQRKRRVTVVRPGAVDTPFWEKVPFKLPPHAPQPEVIADRILDAYQERHKGQLDL